MSKKKFPQEQPKKISKPLSFNEPWYSKHAILLLVFITGIVWLKCVWLNYTYLDDTIFILEKGQSNENFSSIFKAFTEGTFDVKDFYYRPLFRVTFVLERQILYAVPFEKFGDYAFHLAHFTNLLLHVTNVCVLFFFFQKISLTRIQSLAWSVVFALHPVLTMAVAWIPGRNDILLSIFTLACFIQFINYLDTKRVKSFLLFVLYLLLALFTKETAVFIPPVLLLFILLFRKEELLKQKNIFLYAAFAVCISLWYFLRIQAMNEQANLISVSTVTSNIIHRFPALLQYIGKIFLPFNLTVYPEVVDTTLIYGIISISILIFLFVLNKFQAWKQLVFGIAWFILFIFPFFLVPKNINDALFEHRLYIPIVGIIYLVHSVFPYSVFDSRKKILNYSLASVCVLFSFISFNYMNYFNDEIIFYRKAVSDSPHSAYATNMLGIRLAYKEQNAEALSYFKKAFQLDSTLMYTRYFLAKLEYMDSGKLNEAKNLLIAETKYSPKYVATYFDLAHICFMQSDNQGMIFYLKKFLEITPDDKMVNENLLKAYIEQGEKKKSLLQIQNMRKNGINIDQKTLNEVNSLPDSL